MRQFRSPERHPLRYGSLAAIRKRLEGIGDSLTPIAVEADSIKAAIVNVEHKRKIVVGLPCCFDFLEDINPHFGDGSPPIMHLTSLVNWVLSREVTN